MNDMIRATMADRIDADQALSLRPPGTSPGRPPDFPPLSPGFRRLTVPTLKDYRLCKHPADVGVRDHRESRVKGAAMGNWKPTDETELWARMEEIKKSYL